MGGTSNRAAVVLTVVLAIGALTLAGCGGTDDEATTATTAGTPTTAAAPATTAAPPTTGTDVPDPTITSTPTAEVACPAIAARAPEAGDQTIPVDFDGDGTADTLRVYQGGSDWHVRGEIGGDGFHDQVVEARGATMAPLFGARLNPDDDNEEAWVRVGNGAYTGILTIFVFRDCELQRPSLNGNPFEVAAGASVRNAVGVSCFMFDQGIQVFETQSDDGITYTGQSWLYTLNVTSQPAPTLDLVAGWPMPVDAGTPRPELSRLTCGS